jgi:hypothetical protein
MELFWACDNVFELSSGGMSGLLHRSELRWEFLL